MDARSIQLADGSSAMDKIGKIGSAHYQFTKERTKMHPHPGHRCQPELLMENVGGDHELFLQLTEIFERESIAIFEQMRTAASASDYAQLGRHSHSLKGTVGPLGADELVKMLILIEDECDAGQCVCNEERMSTIADELSQVKRELQQFIARF